MNRACRVLSFDVKGTSHFLVRDPDVLTRRLRRFYEIGESIPMRFGAKLGENARTYNHTDALLITVFNMTLPSSGILQVAETVVQECEDASMEVRCFLTRGVENEPEPRPVQWSGDEPKPYQFLFGVNTAVMTADIGEHAHLPGRAIYADDFEWPELGKPDGETYVVDGRRQCFLVRGERNWVPHPSTGAPRVGIEHGKPLVTFHRLR